MSAAVVAHAVGSYPYPQAVLSQVSRQPPIGSTAPGRPCRNATHMRSADGQSAVFSLDGPLRTRVPLEAGFPSVQLRLRPLHATTAATWTARRNDQLAAYFSEAAARYKAHPAAGRWADWADEASAPPASVFPNDPAVPRRRPLTVGVGTGNRKNRCSCAGGVIFAARAEAVDAAVATESRDRFRRRAVTCGASASSEEEEEERQTRLEVQRHRERMRESAQVADLLAPAGAAGGDSRSRFWSENARATAGAVVGDNSAMRRCSTAPAETSFRRVSGNRVLSRLRDRCGHAPFIS